MHDHIVCFFYSPECLRLLISSILAPLIVNFLISVLWGLMCTFLIIGSPTMIRTDPVCLSCCWFASVFTAAVASEVAGLVCCSSCWFALVVVVGFWCNAGILVDFGLSIVGSLLRIRERNTPIIFAPLHLPGLVLRVSSYGMPDPQKGSCTASTNTTFGTSTSALNSAQQPALLSRISSRIVTCCLFQATDSRMS